MSPPCRSLNGTVQLLLVEHWHVSSNGLTQVAVAAPLVALNALYRIMFWKDRLATPSVSYLILACDDMKRVIEDVPRKRWVVERWRSGAPSREHSCALGKLPCRDPPIMYKASTPIVYMTRDSGTRARGHLSWLGAHTHTHMIFCFPTARSARVSRTQRSFDPGTVEGMLLVVDAVFQGRVSH
jgi:hypothetical protein